MQQLGGQVQQFLRRELGKVLAVKLFEAVVFQLLGHAGSVANLARLGKGVCTTTLVQDVFVKLYLRLIDSEDPCKYQISYLYTMLETLYIDHIRGYHNKNTVSIDDDMQNYLELINNNGNDYPDKCAEQADITTIIMTPLRKAEKLVKQAKVQSEKHFAQHRKEKVEKDVNNAIETFNQLYHYGYSLQEMATNLGLTLEQVKYREKKLLNIIKAGLSPHYPHFNTKRVNLLSYQ